MSLLICCLLCSIVVDDCEFGMVCMVLDLMGMVCVFEEYVINLLGGLGDSCGNVVECVLGVCVDIVCVDLCMIIDSCGPVDCFVLLRGFSDGSFIDLINL